MYICVKKINWLILIIKIWIKYIYNIVNITELIMCGSKIIKIYYLLGLFVQKSIST